MGAGSFEGKLEEITNNICSIREKNGEKVNKASIYSNVLEGYQMISSIARNSDEIAEILAAISGEISVGNIPTNFVSRATEMSTNIVEKNIETEEYTKNTLKTFGTMAAVTVGVSAIAEISASEHLVEMKKIIDSTFTPEIKEKINDRLVEAKEGDKKAIGALATVKNASVFFATHHILDEKSERGALAWMMNLSQIDTPEARRLLNQMAKKYNMNVFKETQEGKQAVSKNMLTTLFKQKVSKANPKLLEIDFSNVVGKRTQRAAQSRTFDNEKNADTFVNKIESIARKNIIRSKINLALETDNIEKLDEIKQADPEGFKEILDEKINAYNSMTEKGVDTDRSNIMFGRIKTLSEVGRDRDVEMSAVETIDQKIKPDKKMLNDANEMEL